MSLVTTNYQTLQLTNSDGTPTAISLISTFYALKVPYTVAWASSDLSLFTPPSAPLQVSTGAPGQHASFSSSQSSDGKVVVLAVAVLLGVFLTGGICYCLCRVDDRRLEKRRIREGRQGANATYNQPAMELYARGAVNKSRVPKKQRDFKGDLAGGGTGWPASGGTVDALDTTAAETGHTDSGHKHTESGHTHHDSSHAHADSGHTNSLSIDADAYWDP